MSVVALSSRDEQTFVDSDFVAHFRCPEQYAGFMLSPADAVQNLRYERYLTQERNGLLRREGIYSAYITEWRRERDRAASAPVPERKPGRPGKSPAEAENEKLRKENEKLAAKLAKTEAALEIMGKVHALLETLSESADSEKNQKK